MTIDRQPIVRCMFPCEFVSAKLDGDSCELDLGGAKVSLTGKTARKAVFRMIEAKRKRCGKFDLVLEMPAHGIQIGAVSKDY